MKSLKFGLVLFFVVLMGFFWPRPGWTAEGPDYLVGEKYIGFSIGYVMPESIEIHDDSAIDYRSVSLDDGLMNGLRMGWRPFENLAYELEYNYITGIEAPGQLIYSEPGIDFYFEQGEVNIHALFFNFILRNPPAFRGVTPYMGFGVGIAGVQFRNVRFEINLAGESFIGPEMSESDTEIAGQLLAGCEFDIDEHWTGTVGYKFLYVSPEFDDMGFDTIFRIHTLTAGLNYTF